jgi:hypothetical protein
MTKSVEELEREFARQVGRFIDLAMAEGHSLQEAKAMARDVVARVRCGSRSKSCPPTIKHGKA